MKYLSITALLVLACCSGCGNKEDNNNENSISARADSIVGLRMQEINRQAMDDLEQRIAIEVKAKADSIVAARKNPGKAAKPDSVKLTAPHVSDEEIIKQSKPAYDTAR